MIGQLVEVGGCVAEPFERRQYLFVHSPRIEREHVAVDHLAREGVPKPEGRYGSVLLQDDVRVAGASQDWKHGVDVAAHIESEYVRIEAIAEHRRSRDDAALVVGEIRHAFEDARADGERQRRISARATLLDRALQE